MNFCDVISAERKRYYCDKTKYLNSNNKNTY